MQIDLLRARSGEVGLLGNSEFDAPVAGVIFDVQQRSLTLEFGETADSILMNVPVGEEFVQTLKKEPVVHICIVVKGRIVQASQAPLVKVSIDEDDDFYYPQTQRGIAFAQAWLDDVVYGQPIHRDDLGDESSAKGVIPELSAASLRIAPQLAQQLAQEQALARQHMPQPAPQMAPPSLGPGSRMSTPNLASRTPRPPSSSDNEG